MSGRILVCSGATEACYSAAPRASWASRTWLAQPARKQSSRQAFGPSNRALTATSRLDAPFLYRPDSSPSSTLSRSFATYPPLRKKKGGKQESKSNIDRAEQRLSDSPVADPYDLSSLTSDIERIQNRLKDDLSKLKPGGRFDTTLLENLRVPMEKVARAEGAPAPTKPQQQGGRKKGEQKAAVPSSGSIPVGDLAQVVPRGGRMAVLIVSEEQHVKPITSAILASPYNLNPQPSPTNPLELQIPIPPPSAETRAQTLAMADKARERAEFALRQARGDMQKTMRAMKLTGGARPDDLKRAHDKMEKVADDAKTEIKKLVDASRKALSG